MTTPTFAIGDRVTFNATTPDRSYDADLADLSQYNGSTGTIGRGRDYIVDVIWDAGQDIRIAGPGVRYASVTGRACFTANLLPLVEPAPKVGDIVEYQNVRSGTSAHNGARGVVKSITGTGRIVQVDWIAYPHAYAPPRFPDGQNLKVVSPPLFAVDPQADIDLPALRERLLTLITPNLADDQTDLDAITIARAYERYITTGATS